MDVLDSEYVSLKIPKPLTFEKMVSRLDSLTRPENISNAVLIEYFVTS